MKNKNKKTPVAGEDELSTPAKPSIELNEFEKDAIGNFVLKLYHESHIQTNGLVLKETVRRQFREYVKGNSNYEKIFTNINIGTLIRDSKFLMHTPEESEMFCICIPNLIEFQNCKLMLLGKDFAGRFLLNLLHRWQIQKSGLIQKSTVRREFQEYFKKSPPNYKIYFNNTVIGTLLRKSNFLFNTPRGSDSYCIGMRRLFEFRNEKLKQFDDARLYKDKASNSMLLDANNDKDKPLEDTIEVSPDAEEFPVIYQGGCVQQVLPNFTLTSLGCYICQKNFEMQLDFEEHVSTHGFETDFEFFSSFVNETDNIFEIIYRLCNESHFFNFTMKTTKKDVIIEKIIIVQTRLMHYVKNNKLPHEISSDGIESFFVDSHLFTMGVEQPIVVVYSYKSNRTIRFIEQHHFLNTQKPKRKRIRRQVRESSPNEGNIQLLADDELWKSFEKLMQRIHMSIDGMLSQLDDREECQNLQRTDEFPQVHFPIRACRLPHDRIMKKVLKHDDYYASEEIKAHEKAGFPDSALCNISQNLRNYIEGDKVLNSDNICDVLRTLLHIEDLEGMRAYACLNQKGIKINRFGKEYSVRFAKLPKNVTLESIVSPMDEIILSVSQPDSQKNSNHTKKEKVHFAIVERVYYNQVSFKYDKHVICEKKLYDVKVRPSRLQLIYQLRAVSMLDVHTVKYLLPRTLNMQKDKSPTLDLKLFNPAIVENPEQLQAVRNIANGPSSVAPYVIFGPPGTGKTSTVVEAVLQLWKLRPETRILITAGSNSACDEVAIRLCRVLIDLQPDKMNILRIFAKSNEKRIDSIDDILIEASNFYRAHFYPAVEVIREYRIVVCTLSVVGKLVTANIGADFFTHVFIDECAASTVPEVLVGWMGTSSSKTRLIIAGDHKQLGPIVKSKRAGDLGLSVSFMDQLMNMSCYGVDSNGQYNRSIQTRLIRNYRSHPEIVGIYNRMYYNRELKAMANKEDIAWGLNWHLLPNKNHPIVFHSVYGNSRKINNSVSLCNEQEVNVVLEYVKDLLYFGIKGRKVEETDIGIISPYKKQYIRIQEELNARRWHQIEVGAVETFQGKEKPIIIVSTVRSFTKTLGFLTSPRRLNVILSRPKSLLIMVGNPITLSQNEEFKLVIDECRDNKSTVGGFRGYGDKSPDENLENALEKLSLDETSINNFIPALVEETRKVTKQNRNHNIGSIKAAQLKPMSSKAKAYKYTNSSRSKKKASVHSNNDDKEQLNLNLKRVVVPPPNLTKNSSLNMRSRNGLTNLPTVVTKTSSSFTDLLLEELAEQIKATVRPTPSKVADLGKDSPRPSFVKVDQTPPKLTEIHRSPAQQTTPKLTETHRSPVQQTTPRLTEIHRSPVQQTTPRLTEFHRSSVQQTTPRLTETHRSPVQQTTPKLTEIHRSSVQQTTPRLTEIYRSPVQQTTPRLTEFHRSSVQQTTPRLTEIPISMPLDRDQLYSFPGTNSYAYRPTYRRLTPPPKPKNKSCELC